MSTRVTTGNRWILAHKFAKFSLCRIFWGCWGEIYSFLAHFPSFARMCEGCPHVKVSPLTVNFSALVHTIVKYIADHKSKEAMYIVYTKEQLQHTPGKVSCQCVRTSQPLQLFSSVTDGWECHPWSVWSPLSSPVWVKTQQQTTNESPNMILISWAIN